MKRTRRIVVLATAVISVLVVVVLHRPLVAWFTGEEMSHDGKQVGAAKASAGPFALDLALKPDPPRQEGNALVIGVKDANGKPIDGADVTVEYMMPAMGAMSEMKGMAEIHDDDGDGRFRARFDLPMAGSWTLTTRVRAPQGSGEAQHSITIGRKGLSLVGGATSAAPSGMGKSASVKALQLSPQALGAVQEAMSSLDQVRARLATDTLDGVADPATRTATMLREAAKLIEAPDAKECLAEGASAADALGKTRDIAEARNLFAVTSSYLAALAAADPRLQEGWKIFECPMVDASYGEGRNKWLQRGAALENPYMGKKMLACGSASTFTMPAAALATHGHAAHAGSAGDADEVEYYTCSMHPSVKQEQPGTCPICAMNLTPVTKGELESGVVIVDDIRRQKIGVKTARVEKRALDASITTVGRVVYDEQTLQDVTLKVGGFVEELLADETGQKVSAGQTLFVLYSPELYVAQVEYLQALKTAKTLFGSDFAESLARSARRRLELWDLGDKQIDRLVERGEATDRMPITAPASGYVIEKQVVKGAKIEAGAVVYRIANLDVIWIEADVYESDLPKVKVGQIATITLPYLPGKDLEGQVAFIYPFLDKGTRTGRVRVEMKNPGLELKPEMFANVTLHATEGEGEQLVVPASAVIYTGPRRLVFVDLGEGRLKPVVVRLGKKTGECFEVLDGLQEGDIVVTSGNFLIAAESRLKGAVEYWAEEAADAGPATRGRDGWR